jgi:hypothetical protein
MGTGVHISGAVHTRVSCDKAVSPGHRFLTPELRLSKGRARTEYTNSGVILRVRSAIGRILAAKPLTGGQQLGR